MEKKEKAKHSKRKRSKLQILCIAIFALCIVCIVYYLCNWYITRNKDILDDIDIDTSEVTKEKTARMLQLEELQKENSEIIGWIEIEGTIINYPVCQPMGDDDSYYMTRNYKKEKDNDGAIFLDPKYNWKIPSTNLLLYGHNNKNGTMFQELMNYKKEDYYKDHSKIRFTTIEEDAEYEIIAVFLSRVYYKNEENVFRFYYFIDAEYEDEFDYYVSESKKASLYDTGKTAIYGEQLMTLVTCEYSQEDGRLAVVLKKISK